MRQKTGTRLADGDGGTEGTTGKVVGAPRRLRRPHVAVILLLAVAATGDVSAAELESAHGQSGLVPLAAAVLLSVCVVAELVIRSLKRSPAPRSYDSVATQSTTGALVVLAGCTVIAGCWAFATIGYIPAVVILFLGVAAVRKLRGVGTLTVALGAAIVIGVLGFYFLLHVNMPLARMP